MHTLQISTTLLLVSQTFFVDAAQPFDVIHEVEEGSAKLISVEALLDIGGSELVDEHKLGVKVANFAVHQHVLQDCEQFILFAADGGCLRLVSLVSILLPEILDFLHD